MPLAGSGPEGEYHHRHGYGSELFRASARMRDQQDGRRTWFLADELEALGNAQAMKQRGIVMDEEEAQRRSRENVLKLVELLGGGPDEDEDEEELELEEDLDVYSEDALEHLDAVFRRVIEQEQVDGSE